MSLVSELREDLRLVRLNNPRYEMFFRVFEFTRGLFKLTLFAAFCLGIWHILYGMNKADTSRNNREMAAALSQQDGITRKEANAAELTELTPERIDLLKQFARDNRPGPASVDVSDTEVAEDAEVAKVDVVGFSVSPETQTEPQLVTSIGDDEFNIINKVPARKPIEVQRLPVVEDTALPEVVVVPAAVEPGLVALNNPLEIDDTDVLKQLQVKMQQPPARLKNSGPGTIDNSGVAVGGAAKEVDTSLVLAKKVDLSTAVAGDFGKVDDINDGSWILKQNPAQYTIQIGSTTNRPFLVRFAKQLPEGQPYSIYQYVFKDQPEYGLGYGLFDNTQEANAALADLSQAVRRYGAFTRKIEILHRQIERLQDKTVAGVRE